LIQLLCESTIARLGEEDDMKRRHHSPEQIVRKFREGGSAAGCGHAFGGVCKHLEVTGATYYRWRNQYVGMKADDAKRLKELEKGNARLKHLVADQALDIDTLKEVNRGNFLSRLAAGPLLIT
jgi:transposase-like protein